MLCGSSPHTKTHPFTSKLQYILCSRSIHSAKPVDMAVAIYFQFIPTWGFPGLEGRHLFINLWKISINFINNPLYHQLTSTSLFFNIDAHPPARYQNQDVDLMLCEMKIAENKKNCYRKRNKWIFIGDTFPLCYHVNIK